MKKGYVLTWDSIIALVFVLAVLTGFLSIPYFRNIGEREVGFQQTHITSEDGMEILSKSGKLSAIASLWAKGDMDGASNETKDFMETIVPKHAGYELYIGDVLVYSSQQDATSDRISDLDANEKTRAVRFISGYTEEEVRGWVASALLYENKTGSVDWVRYEDNPEEEIDMPLSRDDDRRVAYLVVPKNAIVYNGAMNISWIPLAKQEPECPI